MVEEQLQRRQTIINKPEEALNHASEMRSEVMANGLKGVEKYKVLLIESNVSKVKEIWEPHRGGPCKSSQQHRSFKKPIYEFKLAKESEP